MEESRQHHLYPIAGRKSAAFSGLPFARRHVAPQTLLSPAMRVYPRWVASITKLVRRTYTRFGFSLPAWGCSGRGRARPECDQSRRARRLIGVGYEMNGGASKCSPGAQVTARSIEAYPPWFRSRKA
jgi:hypothetical protein